ncbi:MAG: ATP-binding domain-containing protein [Selenomonadaceae bacterium]|nr:ATP-binding domain-containing protein [Selenomonadaceae bacterium]
MIPAFQEFFANEYDDEQWQYPNIVVDEGQDIDDGILSHLCDLSQLYDGIFYVFYDRNQYIMRRDKPEWLDKHAECRLVLYKNCRNTSEIAAMAGNLIGINSKFYVNDVHGMKPKVVFYQNARELQAVAEKFVREMQQENFRLEDIVILSVHSVPHSQLQAERLAGVPVSPERAKGKVWFTSVRKFKGLEAKAVLLIDGDVSKLHEPLMQRILYVGCSRANDYLQIALLQEGGTVSDKGKYYTRLLCE